MTQEQEIMRLNIRLEALKRTLGMLISWMAQNANSPISGKEATQLLKTLDGDPT